MTFNKKLFSIFLLLGTLLYSNLQAEIVTVEGVSGINFDNEVDSISISEDFEIYALDFQPDDITLIYNEETDRFSLYGTAKVKIGNNLIPVSLGTYDEPSIMIEELSITQSVLSITSSFNLYGITFEPEELTFQLENDEKRFSIYGASTVSFGGEEIEVNVGDDETPGIDISEGNIVRLALGVTKDFSLKKITFSPNALGFEWDNENNAYKIYGGATISIGADTVGVSLGDSSFPGIEIQNGTVSKITAGISADFNLKALQFSPDGLSFGWDKIENAFLFYGGATVEIASEEVEVSFGSADNAGIKIEDGDLIQISLGITGDFKISSLQFSPEELTFAYDLEEKNFMMYGSGTFELGSESIEFGMGSEELPGLLMDGSKVKSINLSIAKEFNLKALTINPNPLGVQWDKNDNSFNIFGEMSLDISSQSIEASLGNEEEPGMQIENGKLTYFNATVNSDFNMGGLAVQTEDVNVEYDTDKYYFKGIVTVDQLWSTSVDLSNGGKGLEIDVSGSKNKFKVNDFAIELKQVELGAVNLQNLNLGFSNGTVEEAAATVSFPPGYEVGADLDFVNNPAKLNNIAISFEATSFETALPIGNTGVYIVYMQGSMKNIANPKNYVWITDAAGHRHRTNGMYFEGSVAFTYGGPTNIGGRNAALIYNKNTAIITKSFAVLSADLILGAYRQGSNDWKGQLGDGNITMDLVWNNYYSIDSYMKIPSDPLVKFDLNAKLSNSGALNAKMDVTLYVPRKVPIIGGKRLGGVSGALRYDKKHLHDSYAAGWANYKLFKKRKHGGAKFEFSNKKIDLIGTKGAHKINDQINQALSNSRTNNGRVEVEEWEKRIYTFEIGDNATSLILDVNLDKVVDEAYVSVIGPDGFYDIHELIVTEPTDSLAMPDISVGEEKMKFDNTDNLNLYILNQEVEEEIEDYESSLMTAGEYSLLVSYKSKFGVDSVELLTQYFLPDHFGELEVLENGNGTYNLDLSYWGHNPDSTSISIYWNDKNDYNGYHIGTLGYGDEDENGFGNINIDFTASDVLNEADMHFYFIIDDGDGIPYFSPISEAIQHQAQLTGEVIIGNAGDSTTYDGIMLFHDVNEDSFYTTKSQSDNEEFEHSILTNEQGEFHFHDLEIGKEYTIGIVVPYGFKLATDETKTKTITYDGTPASIHFNLLEL